MQAEFVFPLSLQLIDREEWMRSSTGTVEWKSDSTSWSVRALGMNYIKLSSCVEFIGALALAAQYFRELLIFLQGQLINKNYETFLKNFWRVSNLQWTNCLGEGSSEKLFL